MIWLSTLASLVAASAPATDPPADAYAANALSPVERREIENGEVVIRSELFKTPQGKNAGRGVAFARVSRPVDVCWAVLADYEKHVEFMPRIKRLTFLSRSPEAAKVAHEVEILWSTYRYTLEMRFDHPAHRMSFTLDKTAKNDIKDTSGQWEFFSLGEQGTLVKYVVAVDSGMFVPSFGLPGAARPALGPGAAAPAGGERRDVEEGRVAATSGRCRG